MRVRFYPVLLHAIETGVERGWNRAHKHNDSPPADLIKDEIVTNIVLEIDEWFDIDDETATEKL
jgi:hypothetical protein